MKCPVDAKELRSFPLGDIRIDRCPACRGAWYDQDELRLLKDRESRGSYRWIDIDLWRDRDKFRADPARYVCPRDGMVLTTLRYGDSGVLVDLCGRCSGIWLDRGEYARIVERLEHIIDESTVDAYLGDVREELREVITGPEGVGSELADLAKVLYLLELRFTVEHPMSQSFIDALPKT